ncbi:hypothetical protein NE604_02215 [Anaerofustis stercorihominis]|uniref:Uncharacterized protein n=1 Tax=Anaerofustis stercorihominis DSM 17244 TaxID=445971 RepID=B1C804_9FIRM|nr:hypothetical protein [Anaerofustis stercorihominis]EDS73141.1 hypothetical protein ANASTE_00861 [Anaerofustis stercorihominis DSM 17244]MCQ4794451.1 hypothetical protein [Anaerofustis stercorihominis]
MDDKRKRSIIHNVMNDISNIIGLNNLLILEDNKSDQKRIKKKIKLYYEFIYKECRPIIDNKEDINEISTAFEGEYLRVFKKAIENNISNTENYKE